MSGASSGHRRGACLPASCGMGDVVERPLIDSFNGKLRDKCLNERLFAALTKARNQTGTGGSAAISSRYTPRRGGLALAIQAARTRGHPPGSRGWASGTKRHSGHLQSAIRKMHPSNLTILGSVFLSVAPSCGGTGMTQANSLNGPERAGGKWLASSHDAPRRLLCTTLLAVFIAELIVMLGLSQLGLEDPVIVALLDAVLLTALVFPCVYYFAFKKLIQKNAELVESETRLENRVEKRTTELNAAFQRSKERQLELRILNEMGRSLRESGSAVEACQITEHYIERLFRGTSCKITLAGPTGDGSADESSRGCARMAGPCAETSSPALAVWTICEPLTVRNEEVGTLELENPRVDDPDGSRWENQRPMLRMVAGHLALTVADHSLREELKNQAIRDPLTRLYNRRYLSDFLERELHRSRRTEQPLSVLLLDIDHFKTFNDTFGHDAGDAVLVELGKLMQEWVRGSDVVARYGGEEFVAVLPGSDHDAALTRAETLRKIVESHAFRHQGKVLGQATVSIGIAVSTDTDTDAASLLRVADQAMYQSKTDGRNRVTLEAPNASADQKPGACHGPLQRRA